MAKTPNTPNTAPQDDPFAPLPPTTLPEDRDERTARSASDGLEDRTARSAAADVRGDRGIQEDLERAENVLSDDEFFSMLDGGFDDNRLPNVPRIPGFHCCWLTTSSPYDSISKRLRLGYVPVRYSEVPTMQMPDGTVQQPDGNVTCNEMALYKLPERRFQALMAHYHHRRPLEDEQGTLSKIAAGNDTRDSSGKVLGAEEGDGIETMKRSVERGSRAAVPTFANG